MSDEKEFIRAEALRHRQNLVIDPDWADQAAAGFMSHIPMKDGVAVSLYFPREKEMDTLPLAEKLWLKGINVLLPQIREADHGLDFALWEKGSPLTEGKFGIPVPAKPELRLPDIVLVPLLVFDQRGHRLGYGKGYYDVALKELRQQRPVIAVGFAYAEQACLFALPAEIHDEPLDFVVTPQRVFDFRA